MRLHPPKQIKGPNEVLSGREPFEGGSTFFFGFIFVFILFLFFHMLRTSLSSACGAAVSHLDCLALQFYGSSSGERWGPGVSVHSSAAHPRTDRLAANICQAAKAANMWKSKRAPHLRRLTTIVSCPFEDGNMNRTSVKRGDRARRRRRR